MSLVQPIPSGMRTLEQLLDKLTLTQRQAILGQVAQLLAQYHEQHAFYGVLGMDTVLIDSDGAVHLAAAEHYSHKASLPLAIAQQAAFDDPCAAPEQYYTDPMQAQGSWTDVYRFCALSWYLLRGRPPVAAHDRLLDDRQHQLADEQMDSVMQAIVLGMSLRPTDRPQTMQAYTKLARLGEQEPPFIEGAEVRAIKPEPRRFFRPIAIACASIALVAIAVYFLPLRQEAPASRHEAGKASPLAITTRAEKSSEADSAFADTTNMGDENRTQKPAESEPERLENSTTLTMVPPLLPSVEADPRQDSTEPESVSINRLSRDPLTAAPAAVADPDRALENPSLAVAAAGQASTDLLPAAALGGLLGVSGNDQASAANTGPEGLISPPETDAPEPAPIVEKPVVKQALNLDIRPWGEVYVNGKRQGVSPPLKRLSLSPGQYQITVKNSGLPDHTVSIRLEKGKAATLRHEFR